MANSFTKHFLLALAGTALLSSCSRQYTVMQRTPSVSYHNPVAVPVASVIAEPVAKQPVESGSATPSDVTVAPASVAVPASVATIQTVQKQLNEAVAVNSHALIENRAVQKRVARVQQLLATAGQQTTLEPTTTAAPAKKMSFTERLMLKKINARINKQMAPDQPMAKSLLTLGAIIGIIGLVLLLLNVASPLGIIALIVGLVLILVDLLR